MSCDETLNTQSYLDGELDGVAAQAAEHHLQSCAACQALAADTADLSDLLRNASQYRAPDVLRRRIGTSLARVQGPAHTFWFGAASGVGVSALAAGFAILTLLPPSLGSLAQSVTDAHARALVQGRTIVVASSNHHTVKPWLAAHAGLSPPVADFAADGFALTGGRTDEIAGIRAAVMVYRHGNHEIDLFAWPDRGALLPDLTMKRGFRSRFWKSGDMDFAAVSDVDAAAFEKFVGLARAQRE